MANYRLQHGDSNSTNGVNCGSITVSSSGIQGNPPGSGQPINITDYQFTPKTGGGGTLLNPVPGDMLNLGTYTVAVNGSSYGFDNNATYVDPNTGRSGFYTQPGLTGGIADWDAADGSGKP